MPASSFARAASTRTSLSCSASRSRPARTCSSEERRAPSSTAACSSAMVSFLPRSLPVQGKTHACEYQICLGSC